MSFWRGRRVFITGHTGFKGAWLTLWLTDLGAEVTGFSLKSPTDPNLFNLAGLKDLIRHVDGDVRDGPHLAEALRDAQPDVVIHLAAQALVRRSYDDPAATYAINVMGTVNLLEAVRSTPTVRAVVCVTSDKCYENMDGDQPHREGDPMGGRDPYSSSKGCAELVVAAYRQSYFDRSQGSTPAARLATGRAGNVIGGGDWGKDRLVPDTMRALAAGERPYIRLPHAVRPWQHVVEPLAGYLLLAQRLTEGEAVDEGWNFGPTEQDTRPVHWVVDKLAELWGDARPWQAADDAQWPESRSLSLDCSKARDRLGWRPLWTLEQALERTVVWTQALADGRNMRDVTISQIRSYLDG